MKKPLSIWMLITLVILGFFALFVIYPLILILYQSVVNPENGSLTLAYFIKFLERKYYWSTLVNSFAVTIVSTFVAALIGCLWHTCSAVSRCQAVNI
jgi:iron(III) transport system permease protein